MSSRNILALPYVQRRLIFVADLERPAPPPQTKLSPLLSVAMAVAMPRSFFVISELTERALKRMDEVGEVLLPVSTQEAAGLRFPVGHPRKNVVYVGHPVDPVTYIPAADFHRFIFEHKVAEAQRLLRSLGAVSINVVHLEGWDRASDVQAALSLPVSAGATAVDTSVKADRTSAAGRSVLATMKLTPTAPPRIPDGLVWYSHEPLWQEVAQARMESGLDSFTIDVRSADDYGVNASLRALITKSKLELGGSFVEHRTTIWCLEGAFSSI